MPSRNFPGGRLGGAADKFMNEELAEIVNKLWIVAAGVLLGLGLEKLM
jgi:hypothetical protein